MNQNHWRRCRSNSSCQRHREDETPSAFRRVRRLTGRTLANAHLQSVQHDFLRQNERMEVFQAQSRVKCRKTAIWHYRSRVAEHVWLRVHQQGGEQTLAQLCHSHAIENIRKC